MLPIKRDKLIVVDIEATCWKDNKNPEGIPNEIIEVGLCTLTLPSLTLDDRRSILVKPERSFVSPFCTELTTITPEMVADGLSFDMACRQIEMDYAAKSYVWVSWGNYDKRMFKRQCEERHAPYPFSNRHINFKEMYAQLKRKGKMGIRSAMRRSKLQWEGTHHRGVDDAWNTARLLADTIEKHGTEFLLVAWL